MDNFFESVVKEFLSDPYYLELDKFIAHGDWTLLDHSLHVAKGAYLLAKNSPHKLDLTSLIRGAMLHDFYLYDWHLPHKGHRLHGFRHPKVALEEASKHFPLNNLEKSIILEHMFPLTFWRFPSSKEVHFVLKSDRKSTLYEHKFKKHSLKTPSFLKYAYGVNTL